MDALIGLDGHSPRVVGGDAERKVRAFRAMDAYALEAYQTARLVAQQDGDRLAADIRRSVSRAGGALVAALAHAAGSERERERLEDARACLHEARFQLFLARRLGLFDVRRYRAATLRQEAALREIEALLERRPP